MMDCVLRAVTHIGYKRVTENVTITNCMLSGFTEGTLLDGTLDSTNIQREGLGGDKIRHRIKRRF